MSEGPKYGISEITTTHLSFAEDLRLYADAGADGIGINQPQKLTDPEADLRAFRESGLEASICGLRVSSVLPSKSRPEPTNPADRIERILRSLDEMAPFDPACCVAGPGPTGSYEPETAWEIAAAGLKQVARYAGSLGLTIAIEPIHRSIHEDITFLTDLPETVRLCEEIDEPNVGILFDVWHLWDTPNLEENIRASIGLIVGVQVDDRREPTRSWADRLLPGDGIADAREIFATLKDAGYRGWLDLEIMSDDGSLGEALPDSLWALDPAVLVRDGLQKTRELWAG